jgi:hypothetical protein
MSNGFISVHRSSFRVQRLIAALWFGGGVFLVAIAAPAAFRSEPNAAAAANVVGSMLTRWHYVALIVPLVLLAFQWRRPRGWLVVTLFLAIILASAQAILDTRIRTMRLQSPVAISSLAREHPLRRRFGLLHGASTLLLLAQVIVAGVATAADTES